MALKNKSNMIVEEELQKLYLKQKELNIELRNMRDRRYKGMDDDRAEDIVEEIYRDLKDVEKEIKNLEEGLY